MMKVAKHLDGFSCPAIKRRCGKCVNRALVLRDGAGLETDPSPGGFVVDPPWSGKFGAAGRTACAEEEEEEFVFVTDFTL